MTEAKQQARFLHLPPLSAAELEAEREGERKLNVVPRCWVRRLQRSGDRGGMRRVERQAGSQWLMRG